MRVIIDPRSSYLYGSFYIVGLQELFGRNNIQYSLEPFRELKDSRCDLRFILQDGKRETKYYIHTNDSYQISMSIYNWCDVYGCVNTRYSEYPKENYPKLVSLAPSFGVCVETNIVRLMCQTVSHLIPIFSHVWNRCEWNKKTQKTEHHPLLNIRHFFGRRYKTWKNRLPLAFYANNIPSEDNYIFFLSTLWHSDDYNKNDNGVNLRRAHFIRACKSISNCYYEGGLLGGNFSSNELFSDVVTMQSVAFSDWIEKTKRSALVFNTPAFWDCHGWKLGEYLALGKCIVSTKLSNDLPYPLEHGVNIHFVEDTEKSMREAIEYILAHPDYRHKLEQGAKEYWEKYGTPEASLKLLGI